MVTHKAKQIGRTVFLAGAVGLFFAHVCAADDAGKGFLPMPGEVTASTPAKPVPLPPPIPKTNSVPPPATPTPEIHKLPPPPSSNLAGNDWGTYYRDRASKVLFEGKLVDRSTLTQLVGYLVKERASLSNGKQQFFGAALDIAVRKTEDSKVATALELRPALWRRTDERVFLMNYKPGSSLPGALIRVYVLETEPLEGWRTFKTGSEPSFEDWKRLSGR